MPCLTHTQAHKTIRKTHKLKVTPPRLSVLDILEHSQKPLSVKSIAKKLSRTRIDTATVYRTITSLLTLRLVSTVNFSSKEAYFELAGKKHHHHLICENCGKIVDVESCQADISQRSLLKAGFGYINRHSLEFFGLCNDCLKIQM